MQAALATRGAGYGVADDGQRDRPSGEAACRSTRAVAMEAAHTTTADHTYTFTSKEELSNPVDGV